MLQIYIANYILSVHAHNANYSSQVQFAFAGSCSVYVTTKKEHRLLQACKT